MPLLLPTKLAPTLPTAGDTENGVHSQINSPRLRRPERSSGSVPRVYLVQLQLHCRMRSSQKTEGGEKEAGKERKKETGWERWEELCGCLSTSLIFPRLTLLDSLTTGAATPFVILPLCKISRGYFAVTVYLILPPSSSSSCLPSIFFIATTDNHGFVLHRPVWPFDVLIQCAACLHFN